MKESDVSEALAVLDAWNMAPTPERDDAERSGIIVENAFVAEHHGKVVGTAGWFALSDDVAETASLAVDPGYRGLGVGFRLQEARLAALREQGFRTVRTETDRPATIRWYVEKFGYRRIGTSPKKHEFSLPDVHEWTILELHL
jgi:N-acetylglutamate synthase-like GNAT family acetyltransferase